jgi:hypothetical protein
MEKKNRLDTKIKRLFRQAGNPRYLHHMGPKKFESWTLFLGLVGKQVYRLSYRRASKFLDEHYKIKVHWTTLQKAAKRHPRSLWQDLLAATIDAEIIPLAAADGTGFARTAPSAYYLRRIDRAEPICRPVQMIGIVDVQSRKFASASIRARPGHEIKPLKTAYCKSEPTIDVITLDKGYDSEKLRKWLKAHGTFPVAPVRKGCKNGTHRKLMRDCFDWCLYWQRNIVESLWSALKRLFGSTVMCKHIKTQSAELFCRLIAYNIGYRLWRFSTEPVHPKAI